MDEQQLTQQEVLLFLIDLQEGMENRSYHISGINTSMNRYDEYRGVAVDIQGTTKRGEDEYGDAYRWVDKLIKQMISEMSEKDGERVKYQYRQ